MNKNPLGKKIDIPKQISPDLLFPIKRSIARLDSAIKEPDLFVGRDIWNCYELSWFDTSGKPISAVCQISYDCNSPCIVESKSLKLYLYSFNLSQFENSHQVESMITHDLSKIIGSDALTVSIFLDPNDPRLSALPHRGICIDDLVCSTVIYSPAPELLSINQNSEHVAEILHSNIFRSLCPVTSQPDWATVTISYQGAHISHQGLLAYLISYRNHQGYHEDCGERIFSDILKLCSPRSLSVVCNFLRRGGIDINPIRSTPNATPLVYQRIPRQ
jgi:7-cyano-7-deazaguanine reductase